MSRRKVGNRTEPRTGSARANRMAKVREHTETVGDGSYADIADATGLSKDQVRTAAGDQRRFAGDDHPSRTPAQGNANTYGKGWGDEAKTGMATQAKGTATRLEVEAVELERNAAHETDPAKKALMVSWARQNRATAANERAMAVIVTAPPLKKGSRS